MEMEEEPWTWTERGGNSRLISRPPFCLPLPCPPALFGCVLGFCVLLTFLASFWGLEPGPWREWEEEPSRFVFSFEEEEDEDDEDFCFFSLFFVVCHSSLSPMDTDGVTYEFASDTSATDTEAERELMVWEEGTGA